MEHKFTPEESDREQRDKDFKIRSNTMKLKNQQSNCFY